jgi:hypothetical protein
MQRVQPPTLLLVKKVKTHHFSISRLVHRNLLVDHHFGYSFSQRGLLLVMRRGLRVSGMLIRRVLYVFSPRLTSPLLHVSIFLHPIESHISQDSNPPFLFFFYFFISSPHLYICLSAECLSSANPQDDLKATLHPRSTGLLFILRTLLPSLPDLQLMDVTIGYPGVPFTAYPQDYFGLLSIFFRSVPPPTVHLHLHIHSDLGNGEIPSLITPEEEVRDDTGLASPEEARAFELWLRGKWEEKDKRMEGFARDQKFGEESEVVPIRQV